MSIIRRLAALSRFSMRSLLVGMLILALGIVWWQDRQQMVGRISKLEQQLNPTWRTNSWSVEQATGRPDTTRSGDQPTAWASATQDSQPEWLELTYAKHVKPNMVVIHETFNPGAVVRVTSLTAGGSETTLWEGTDPTPTTAARGVSKIPVFTKNPTNRIRIYLASDKVPGWNEIDAVGIRYSYGRVMWAKSAKASSSYGRGSLPVITLNGPTLLQTR